MNKVLLVLITMFVIFVFNTYVSFKRLRAQRCAYFFRMFFLVCQTHFQAASSSNEFSRVTVSWMVRCQKF